MGSDDDPLRRDRWANLRFGIIGGLLAAPPAAGDFQAALNELAARAWRHPLTGLAVRFDASTIQSWYHAARGAINIDFCEAVGADAPELIRRSRRVSKIG